VTVIGIDEATCASVSDIGRYVQHPANRQQLDFQLKEGGYDVVDHQATDPSKATPRPKCSIPAGCCGGKKRDTLGRSCSRRLARRQPHYSSLDRARRANARSGEKPVRQSGRRGHELQSGPRAARGVRAGIALV